MRYMLMFKSEQAPEAGKSPCRKELPEMAKLMKELTESGVMVFNEGLLPSDSGAQVRVTPDGKSKITDGPFAEAKELVAGFAVVNVKSKQEAIDLAQRFLTIAGGGISDILEVFEPVHS